LWGSAGRSAVVALVLGAALLWLAVRFAVTRSDRSARWLFFSRSHTCRSSGS
jgi:hypothetical protein